MRNRGFSLVELAISVTVIGILLAAVIKGEELIDRSRMMTVASDLDYYVSAVNSFKDLYGGLPGDLTSATRDIHLCNSSTHCTDGDGNGIVGIPVLNHVITNSRAEATEDGQPEMVQFFKHLALAGMINTVNVAANPNEPKWGETNPRAPFPGGYQVVYGKHDVWPIETRGTWLFLRRNVTGPGWVPSEGANVMSPIIAQALDKKIDDGMPDMGKMQEPDDGASCDHSTAAGRIYRVTSIKECAPAFLMPF